MSTRLPLPLQELADQFKQLPGLGPKSALRIVMQLLAWPADDTRAFGKKIADLRDQMGLCSLCGGISASDPCPICADKTRDCNTLCIVPEWDSLLTIEEGGFYQGQYLVLGGLFSPIQDKYSSTLNLDLLVKRLQEEEIEEVILALGATLEAENTASFIKEFLLRRFPAVRVTRLAQGIPLGGQVKFMDKETLRQSLKYRHEL